MNPLLSLVSASSPRPPLHFQLEWLPEQTPTMRQVIKHHPCPDSPLTYHHRCSGESLVPRIWHSTGEKKKKSSTPSICLLAKGSKWSMNTGTQNQGSVSGSLDPGTSCTSVETWVQAPEPMQWSRKKTDSTKVSSDLHVCHSMQALTYIHNNNEQFFLKERK